MLAARYPWPRGAAQALQSYPDQLAFRHYRRKTKGAARIFAGLLEKLVASKPLTMTTLIEETCCCWRWFMSSQVAPA